MLPAHLPMMIISFCLPGMALSIALTRKREKSSGKMNLIGVFIALPYW
jgi:hypothetical protein